MYIITSRNALAAFAVQNNLRPDWHEPDEQGITARVEGVNFDNAGFWPTLDTQDPAGVELHVIFSREVEDPEFETGHAQYEDIAAVNLATLCAWAAGDGS